MAGSPGPVSLDPTHSLITGAGSGIGLATARRLSARGDALGLHARSHEAEVRTLAEEHRRAGGEAHTFQADLSRPADVEAFATEALRSFPCLDVLILNAGVYPRRKFRELSREQFEETLQVNLLAPFQVVRRLLGALERSPQGARVIFVTSVLAFNGSERGADYAASKAALLGLTRSLARELAPRIRVNAVAPGSIDTAILGQDTPEVRARRESAIPLGRIGRPEEVAAVIDFLSRPDSGYLTGTTVHVNGGLRMD